MIVTISKNDDTTEIETENLILITSLDEDKIHLMADIEPKNKHVKILLMATGLVSSIAQEFGVSFKEALEAIEAANAGFKIEEKDMSEDESNENNNSQE